MELFLLWGGALLVSFVYRCSTEPGTEARRKANNYLLASILGPLGLILAILCWLNDD